MRRALTLFFSLAIIGGGGPLPALAQGGHARAFARTDANGDGKVSLQEFLAARGHIFDEIDTDHDGVITPAEIDSAQQRFEAAAAGRMIRSGREGPAAGGQIAHLRKLAEQGPLTRERWNQVLIRRFERLDTLHVGYLTLDQMRPRRQMETQTPEAEPMTPSSARSTRAAPGSTPTGDMRVPMASTPRR